MASSVQEEEVEDLTQRYLSKCIVRGGRILHALSGHFRFSSSDDIVFGKEMSIELFVMDAYGHLHSLCDQPVFGMIKDLAVLPKMGGKDLLIALSDSDKMSLLSFCSDRNRFFPVKHVELSTTKTIDFQMLAVHSSGCFIAAGAHEEQLALFSLSMTANDIIDQKIILPFDSGQTQSISSDMSTTSICGTILSMCFISIDTGESYKEHNPVLAIILHRKGEILNELLLLKWNVKAQTITVSSKYVGDGPLAHNIVDVPNSQGLAFLFSAGDVLLMNFRDPCNPCCVYRTSLNSFSVGMEEKTYVEDSCIGGTRKDIKVNEKADPVHNSGREYVCSWSWELDNTEVPRMIFCVDTGELFLIEVFSDSDVLKVEQSECLYKGLPCKELLWVKDGYLAAIVEMGDGLVLKLKDRRLCFTNHILNMAPILDVAHDEKNGQIFACCGVAPEGSLRTIERGISVVYELKNKSDFRGVYGTWAVRMNVADLYHSFIVVSFVLNTAVFTACSKILDVTDAVGFQSDICTLACGTVSDGLLVQICRLYVRLCLPTIEDYSQGIPSSSPTCTVWYPPKNSNIINGAVGNNLIVVSASNPRRFYILGVKNRNKIFTMRRMIMHNEITCISIPSEKNGKKQPIQPISKRKCFLVGTHEPAIEIWFVVSADKIWKALVISTRGMGISTASCIPHSVHLVYVGIYHVLAGLRNGMLLRFEWPRESFDPSHDEASVQLIASRSIGFERVCLVPLEDTLDGDIIVLSGRPWLLQTAGRGISYTSLSFQSPFSVTPVCMTDHPKGILFVANDRLHVVEMVNNKRLNMKKSDLDGTPRKVLYHSRSRMLLVLTESSICCVNPQSWSKLWSEKFEGYGRSMEFLKFKNEQVLAVGISSDSDSGVMSNGTADRSAGFLSSDYSRLFLYQLRVEVKKSDSGSRTLSLQKLKKVGEHTWRYGGVPLAICPYLDSYFLASVANSFQVCGLKQNTRTRELDVELYGKPAWTRFIIRSLTTHHSRIAVGDGCDGVIFFSYDKVAEKLAPLYADPSFRLLADCILMDDNTAVVSDCKGSIAVLCSDHLEDNPSPERNLRLSSAYFMGDVVMSIQKCLYSFPADDFLLSDMIIPKGNDYSKRNAIIASSLKGNIMIFFPLSREEYNLLQEVQNKLAVNHLTEPILGNNHTKFRSRENLDEVPKILDGDMLFQVLELTSTERDTILQSEMELKLLERIHYALN